MALEFAIFTCDICQEPATLKVFDVPPGWYVIGKQGALNRQANVCSDACAIEAVQAGWFDRPMQKLHEHAH